MTTPLECNCDYSVVLLLQSESPNRKRRKTSSLCGASGASTEQRASRPRSLRRRNSAAAMQAQTLPQVPDRHDRTARGRRR